MSVRPYLPSGQFASIVGSIFAAITLVYVAQWVTTPHEPPTPQVPASQKTAWQRVLTKLQEDNAASLPTPPDEDTVAALRRGAQSANLTETFGKTLLVNVADAQSQGAGKDASTQNQLINAALSQIQETNIPSKVYTNKDITIVADSNEVLHRYGNTLITIMEHHPGASVGATYQIIGDQVNGTKNNLPKLLAIGKEYAAFAKELSLVPAPQSLAAYHLSLINAYTQAADSYEDMAQLDTDPLRGLAGLQMYSTTITNIQKLFINITSVFDKRGILFSKDEPGAAWTASLSAQ